DRAFGLANRVRQEKLTPQHRFRIASISKTLTAACIFRFIDLGKLSLHQPIFGEEGVLKFDYARTYSAATKALTVYHLLTHTGGGWTNDGNDPMFQIPQASHRELIKYTLQESPQTAIPGTKYAYSNFGYCLLGRVLEKVGGRPYDEVIKQEILTPCGIQQMQLAENTLGRRASLEVVYEAQGGDSPYTLNINRMDAHGGWIATVSDLVRFALRVDGFDSPPDLLRPTTLKAMTTPSDLNPRYACGWNVNASQNWWHGGNLPGTTTFLMRSSDGLCCAMLTNTYTKETIAGLETTMWAMIRSLLSR
ncbi:serine hydrolase domain-containing protein, partial [Armatimonas sp.]|uniref:serine hydrolase domain-containing protein n=1 Tax=Armatimonas sp. TaxID=1872638 RepID=UPI00286B50A6